MLQTFFFATMYITCKLSVQFCTFPHSLYKGTKTTDFFVTAVSQCIDMMLSSFIKQQISFNDCREHLVAEGRCGPGGSPRMDWARHRWMGVSLSGLLSGSSPGSKGTAEWTYWSFGQLWRGHSKFVCILLDTLELCTAAILTYTSSGICCFAGPIGWLSFPFVSLAFWACGFHTI